MPAKQPKINLLPQEEFETTTFGRVINWALSSFRIIVILTEMVVMLAFLSRFWLDARLTDLNDLIKQKQAVIQAQSDFESKFRLLQKRLSVFASFKQEGLDTSGVISSLTSSLPDDVSLLGFSQKEAKMEIAGTSASERSIAQLIANLEANESFEKVFLKDVSVNPDNQSLLVFTVQVEIKTKGAKT